MITELKFRFVCWASKKFDWQNSPDPRLRNIAQWVEIERLCRQVAADIEMVATHLPPQSDR